MNDEHYCWVCGELATCSGSCGYLCWNSECIKFDYMEDERRWFAKYPEDGE